MNYFARIMILHVDFDLSYLPIIYRSSCVGGHYYVISYSCSPYFTLSTNSPPNGAMNTLYRRTRNFIASAAEASIGGIFFYG